MDLVIARPPGLRVSPRAESSCVRVYHGFHLLTLLVRSDSSMLGARAHHHRRKAPGTRGSEAAAPGHSVASDECLTFRADFVGPSDHTLGRRCCPASMRCWVTWVGGASRPPWAVGSPGSAVPPSLRVLLGHLGQRCCPASMRCWVTWVSSASRPQFAVGSPGSEVPPASMCCWVTWVSPPCAVGGEGGGTWTRGASTPLDGAGLWSQVFRMGLQVPESDAIY